MQLPTEKKFKPQFIIDLATLTGAIIVSLGSEYAGLFSNNDELSKILNAGEKVEKSLENVLHKNYDKLIDSKMICRILIMLVEQDQPLQCRFEKIYNNKTPWAHLDILEWLFKICGFNSEGATGFGVRLLIN